MRTPPSNEFKEQKQCRSHPDNDVNSPNFRLCEGREHPTKNLSFLSKARSKRRILHVPNLMQMRKIYCFRLFALDSAHVKCDV